MFKDIHRLVYLIFMIKRIKDNYKIYSLIIVKTTKKSLKLDYGLLNTTFDPLNHVFAHRWISK
jgi:hypothetical protein